MAFIRTTTEETASAAAAQLLARDRAAMGYVPNYTRTFALRPEVFEAWGQLNNAIKSGMDLRRYELATLAAATALRSSYCSLAHGKVLADKFLSAEEVASLVTEPASDPVDRAVMEFARKVAVAADQVTQGDVDQLRKLGLSDADVLDVCLAAAARCFFSKTLDATGTTADPEYQDLLPPELVEVLTVGRPFA
jgi:uncharacterized peroxidase-related enzyme